MSLDTNSGLYRMFMKNGLGPFLCLGASLLFLGIFLLIQSYTGQFLPHDVEALGMTAAELGLFQEGRIVNFIFHDRVAFGGSLISVGILYLWVTLVPLRQGKRWAWYVMLLSGLYGFGSFLTYLGTDYLDSWHGIGTLLLIPLFLLGLLYSFRGTRRKSGIRLAEYLQKFGFRDRNSLGNSLLLFTGIGLFLGGITIMLVGMSSVFVPQDLGYMQINVCGLEQINANLIPVIAHDRASFGGGLATIGVRYTCIVIFSEPNRLLWDMMALSISIGFYAAIIIHFIIGYLNFWHLAPAYLGLLLFTLGLVLTHPSMRKSKESKTFVPD